MNAGWVRIPEGFLPSRYHISSGMRRHEATSDCDGFIAARRLAVPVVATAGDHYSGTRILLQLILFGRCIARYERGADQAYW